MLYTIPLALGAGAGLALLLVLFLAVAVGAGRGSAIKGCPGCQHTGTIPCGCDGGYVRDGRRVKRWTRCAGNGVVVCHCRRSQ